jgi:hypothetical protein
MAFPRWIVEVGAPEAAAAVFNLIPIPRQIRHRRRR